MYIRIVYGISGAKVCMYVRPGLVLSRLPLKKKFGLHYYVICCVVETKLVMYCRGFLIWHSQLSSYRKLASVKSYEANVSSVSPLSELKLEKSTL